MIEGARDSLRSGSKRTHVKNLVVRAVNPLGEKICFFRPLIDNVLFFLFDFSIMYVILNLKNVCCSGRMYLARLFVCTAEEQIRLLLTVPALPATTHRSHAGLK